MLLCMVLAACGADRVDAPPAAIAPVEKGDASVEWRGRLACADCEGIDTRLMLVRSGNARSFLLTETYLADGGARFVTRGQWQRERNLLRLDSDQGARMAYAVLADGRLQPSDLHGRNVQASTSDVLLPVAAADATRPAP